MKVHFLGAAQTVTGSCYLIEACGIRFTVDCGMHQGNSEIEARNFDTDIYQSGNIDFILFFHAQVTDTKNRVTEAHAQPRQKPKRGVLQHHVCAGRRPFYTE